ncbi:MAG: magnesium transporter CorA family protein [Candidatus Pacebacteria bacterium]|nr:magnesium transporter CorA family protein [Candidatus Paceibacterota bacterium]
MISVYKHKHLTWVDVESPTSDEVRELMETYKVDPLIAEELLLPTLKPRVEVYPNFIYLILHFPAFRHTHTGDPNQEVDFIIGKDFIITTRYDSIDPLHKFSKVFEVNSVLDRSDIGEHAGYLFFYMLRKLYKSIEHELEYITDSLEIIEEDIFEGKEKEMVVALSNVSRDLLNLKQALNPHHEVLSSFSDAGKVFFGESFGKHINSIMGEYYRIKNQVSVNLDTLHELRETNNSLLSTKQNEVMKVLTIMAFVTFPLSLIASIFGMNTAYIPIVGGPHDFWIVLSIMGVATFFMFVFFKRNRWL